MMWNITNEHESQEKKADGRIPYIVYQDTDIIRSRLKSKYKLYFQESKYKNR